VAVHLEADGPELNQQELVYFQETLLSNVQPCRMKAFIFLLDLHVSWFASRISLSNAAIAVLTKENF